MGQGTADSKEMSTEFTSMKKLVFSTRAKWYWLIIVVLLATTGLALTVPEDAYPVVYLRYFFGSICVLFLPGYSLLKALFPQRELDRIERIAISVGLSLAIASMVGLFFNYTPWGIATTPITLSIVALTVAFATMAIAREYNGSSKYREKEASC